MGRFFYILAQITWGFPQTLLGFVVFLTQIRRPHSVFHGAVVTTWSLRSSLSLGLFMFIGEKAPYCRNLDAPDEEILERVLVHEFGHTVQSLVLGPLYLPVIGLPSIVWAKCPPLVRKRGEQLVSYYSFWPERTANWLGECVLRRPSMGQALVD